MTYIEESEASFRRQWYMKAEEWLRNMLADGWESGPSGDGQFLYLRKNGEYYKGPVICDDRFVKMWISITEENNNAR